MKEGLRLAELGVIPFDEKEILHYAMLPSFAPPPEELPLKESLEAAKGAAQCRAVWCRFPLKRNGDELDLGFAKTTSKGLRRHLEGCEEIILFACTAGAEMDRRITRAKLGSPAKGLLMHAIGAQQVEGACDRLCAQLAEMFPDKQLTDLDCGRTVGITLTDSLLMTPSKSVTAIIGMKERKPE